MPVDAVIEKRLAAVEAAIHELRQRLPSSPNWLAQVIGSQANEPAFEEVLAYGRALRAADQTSSDVQP